MANFYDKKSYLYEIWFPILNMEISQGGFWVHITSVKTTRYWKENIHSRRHNQVNKTKIIKLKKIHQNILSSKRFLTNKVVTFLILKVWMMKFWSVPPLNHHHSPRCHILYLYNYYIRLIESETRHDNEVGSL